MNDRLLVRTDHVLRYHLYVDTSAAKFDAFRVEMLEQSYVTTLSGSIDDAWREALDVINLMCSEYSAAPVRDPAVFQAFAIITAVEHARELAKLEVRNQIIAGFALPEQSEEFPGPEPEHTSQMNRVRALCKALDAVEFLQRLRPQALY